MADKLIETDVEKAKGGGLMPRGGSKRMLRYVAGTGKGGRKTPQYRMARFLASRTGERGKLRSDRDGYQHLKKSADPVETLYAEIEKARGLLPKGGSSKMLRVAQRRLSDPADRSRLGGYLENRYKGGALNRNTSRQMARRTHSNDRLGTRFRTGDGGNYK